MTDNKDELKRLIEELSGARNEYYRLRFDEPSPDKLGRPCPPKQIARLEQTLGWNLPPSYRTFLELHDGWDNFDGGAKLLSLEDQRSVWVSERVGDFGELFDENPDAENPFSAGAIPIMMGQHENNFVVLDPRKPKPNGEMQFVAYDYSEKERSFKDFIAYLSHKLTITRKLIQRQRLGRQDD
jgi:cell wall assembly regulator SMI1